MKNAKYRIVGKEVCQINVRVPFSLSVPKSTEGLFKVLAQRDLERRIKRGLRP